MPSPRCAVFSAIFPALLVVTLAFAACSKSNRSSAPPVVPQPSLPQKIAFTLELPAGAAGLAVTLDTGGAAALDITVPTVNLGGSIDRTNDDLLVRLGPQATAALAVSAALVFPDITVNIVEPIVVPGASDHPTDGGLVVTFDAQTLLVTMDATTITLDLNAGQQVAVLAWADFEAIDVFGSDPEFQRLGAFAFAALEFVVEQGFRCIEGFGLIADHEDELNALGPDVPVVIAGDLYPPTMQTGQLEFAWHDTGEPLSAGQIGPDDGFTSTFVDFWRDDPNDDVDERLDGVIDYLGYHEDDHPFWLHFAEVRFTDFTIVETEETAPGVFVEDLTTTWNGSLTVQVVEG